jgi:hypothetical protein
MLIGDKRENFVRLRDIKFLSIFIQFLSKYEIKISNNKLMTLLNCFRSNQTMVINSLLKNSKENFFNYSVVSKFALVTVLWGIVGMAIGVLLAAELAFPDLTAGIPWLSYGRLRPLHTNAVIFAFGGSALFAASYYVVQRTCQTRLFSDALAEFTFGGGKQSLWLQPLLYRWASQALKSTLNLNGLLIY